MSDEVQKLKCGKCGWSGTAGEAISHKFGYDCPKGCGRIYNHDGSKVAGSTAPKTSKSAGKDDVTKSSDK